MAHEVGMPGGYDVGPQRISWLGQLLSNWMGDAGFVRRLSVQVRRPNVFGDVSWCTGTLTDKRLEDGVPVVELALAVVNQLNETTATGTALVALPARAASP
jgi:hypothetical protein